MYPLAQAMGDPDHSDGAATEPEERDLDATDTDEGSPLAHLLSDISVDEALTDLDGDLFGDVTEFVEPFSSGSFFGERFRIEEPLGAGGMGAVYRARDLELNEDVALKILVKGRADGEARERFQREYEILSSLQHPGIIGIRGFGASEQGVPWLAMELLEGETLRARVRRKGPMDPSALAPILRATCDALAAAHAAGIIHRDLKPDHIFLPKVGATVKLLDFGLSLAMHSKKLTRTGTILGTPRYMAPEQIASAHSAGATADIYALGVICFEALVGESPFTASDQGQLLGAILSGRIDSLVERRPDVSADLEEVLNKAMAKRPEDRFQAPHELATTFAMAAGLPAPLSFAPPPRRSSRPPKRSFLKPLLLGVLGLAVVAFGAFVSYLLLR